MRWLFVGALLPLAFSLHAASAQPAVRGATDTARPASRRAAVQLSPDANGMTSLDTWIVVRLRGAQLMPDSVPVVRSVAKDAVLPHVESVREGARFDTLFAVQYAERPGAAALAGAAAVRMVGQTGTITPIAGRVIARRPFRALRAPTANHNEERDWRYGWAYLIAVPKSGRASPAMFRGWMVVDTLAGRR